MKKSVLVLAFMACGLCSVSAQSAQVVLTFEDVPNYQLSDGYGGISGWEYSGQLGSHYLPESPDNLGEYFFHGWNGGELSFDQGPVIFEGMYYNNWGGDNPVSYELYFQGKQVYAAPFDWLTQPLEPYWLASGYTGLVDKIHFYTSSSDGILIDNFTYSTVVPLPGAMGIFSMGLGLWTLLRNRRQIIDA
ncbi:MAG: hypothetical protein CTY19_02700 [Methylomonas sp.]|nr:MAG: hypothetical protein CTY19_02700 [Methylomonas sp.]